MSTDAPATGTSPSPGGLFSSLTFSRRTPRPSSEMRELVAHPLLGASTSSLQSDHSDDTAHGGARNSDTVQELGSSPPDSSSVSTLSTANMTGSGMPSTGLPYKPRQKPVPPPSPTAPGAASSNAGAGQLSPGMVAAPTTSTSTSTMFAVPAAASADTPQLDATVTSRLQLQSLKAAAQRIGLANGSMGMGMIDSIFDKGARGRSEVGDWADLLKVLTCGKAIILLPGSPASSLPMTPQTLRDHIAFLSPPISLTSGTPTSNDNTAVLVTLSGLVGTLRGNTVIFESTVSSDTPLVAALRDDAQRTAVLSRLRPTQTAAAAALFPNYTLSSESALLPFPALGKSVPLGIPDKTVKEPPRRINPFASLFGSSSAPVSLSPSPGPARNLAPESGSPNSGNVSQLSSPHPSIRSLEPDTSSPDPAEGYTVTAYTIDKPVRYNEVYKELVKAVRSSVRHDLDGMPDKVVDKTLKLVVSSVCPVSGVNAADQALLKSHHQVMGSETSSTVPLDFSDPTTTGERVQDFMEAIYDDLVIHYRTADSPRKSWTRSNSAETSEEEDSDKKAQQREEHVEQLASEGTERVEALVCRLLYNRIFSPLHSDDGRHDEALASRIAALNLLDLSLDHLGLITRPPGEKPKGAIAKGLAKLCSEIGHELQKLCAPDCLTPKDKTDVLVKAHKIAVLGLESLPPIQLRPEDEPYVAPPPQDEPAEEDEDQEKQEEEVPEDDTAEKPHKRATSGADLILPLMIYSVVKANPPHLASQLMYLRRYRSAICLVGEESYAIVNLTAVVEFLEHVQLSELGLGDSDRVMSVESLTPIGLAPFEEGTDAASIASASSRLRGRVFQVSELAGSAAGSANKVITGVVDSSWSALRGIIGSAPQVTETPPEEDVSTAAPAKPLTRPRQSSTFSLASVTASVASMAARSRSRAASSASDWPNQELMEVARPDGLREHHDIYEQGSDGETEPGNDSLPVLDDESHASTTPVNGRSRSRSILSVSSMRDNTCMSREVSSGGRDDDKERETLGRRIAQIGGFRRGSPAPDTAYDRNDRNDRHDRLSPSQPQFPPSSQSLLPTFMSNRLGNAGSIGRRGPAPLDEALHERFMTCDPGDIRLTEVPVLLREYRRLVASLRGGP